MTDSSMMFPNSTCSTLAILIAFSRSIASCVVAATGSDITPGVRWQSCGWRFSTNAHSIGSLACVPASVFVTDLFSLCCPLSLGNDGADFMSSLVLGSGSSSTGFSFGSRAASLAESGTGTVALASPSLLLLCYALRTSSASASLITSLLRSNLSAHCGVILTHPSIHSLQRSECAYHLWLSLVALKP